MTPLRLLPTSACLLFSLILTGCQPPPPPAPSPNRSEAARRSSERDRPHPEYREGRRDDREPRSDNGDFGPGNTYARNDDRGTGSNRDGRRRNRPSQGSGFDFYLLNLSWSPEFCATHPGKPECAEHLGFVLHGLWPQNFDGSYPEHCADAPGPQDPSAFRDLYPDPGLLQHEWQTHGTCSGLQPDAFFNLARRAVHNVTVPQQISGLDHQASLPPSEILGLFAAANPSIPGSSLALSCGNNYLTAVEVCLGKDLHPIACQQVRSCRANTVRIPPR